MFSLERASAPRRVGWLSLVGLVLIPLLVAGGFLWATWNSDTRLDRVQAAIVNEDEPVRLDGQLVPLGRQLAGGLVTGGDSETDNFDWLLTDAADARSGLADGRYAAVVTIPEDFSARATSFSQTEASQISPAEVRVQTSQIRGIADTVVGQSIAAAATSALNTSLTEQYLDNIYVGFNSTKKQFETVADGARKLADGSGDLSGGLDQTSTGAEQLADGLEQLDDGTQTLADGTGELNTGASQLATGLRRLADGTRELPTQTEQLADGAEDAADGADDLADGVRQYVNGVKQLDKQLPQFANGVGRSADGAEQLATGLGRLSKGLTQYAEGSQQFNEGLETYARTINSFQELVQTPDRLPAQLRCPVADPRACELYYGGLVAGTQTAYQGLQDQRDPETRGVTPGLLTGARDLADNAETLANGLARSSDGAKSLGDGLDRLDTGAGQIASGVDKLATNGTKLASGTKSLAVGLDELADGTDQLATGLRPLSTGIAQAATGASQLATGVSQLSTGTRELADGTSQSADGARELSDGIVKLADGGEELADGTDELADGLAKGAEQVPTYDETTRTKLAEVVANPVTAEQPKNLFADIANTTFLAAIALWLGGLASFVVLRAVPAGVLTSMAPTWRLAGAALLPAAAIGLVQALALTAVLQVLLQLDAGQVAQLLPFLILAGVAFAALNQALVAWLGGAGRFISVILVVLAAAGAITSAVPAAFDVLTPFLPLTPALEGARAIVSNGSGAFGSLGLLAAWLVVGVAASVLAVARRRIAPARAPVTA
jgi:putative membrane protein